MKAKIAVVTVSGKAYYLLVSELKKRNAAFLSLTPNDHIPKDIRVVLTTRKEGIKIAHQNVLEYEEDKNPVEVVDQALRITKGKRIYEKLVVGIDPGQHFGVAVLGDGNIIETKNCSSLSETVNTIQNVLSRTPTMHTTIRIGNGAPSYSEELWRHLNEILPGNVAIESVREEGTSKSLGETSHRREERNVISAIRIGQRHGRVLSRKRKQ